MKFLWRDDAPGMTFSQAAHGGRTMLRSRHRVGTLGWPRLRDVSPSENEWK
jgi:hypothetical protein